MLPRVKANERNIDASSVTGHIGYSSRRFYGHFCRDKTVGLLAIFILFPTILISATFILLRPFLRDDREICMEAMLVVVCRDADVRKVADGRGRERDGHKRIIPHQSSRNYYIWLFGVTVVNKLLRASHERAVVKVATERRDEGGALVRSNSLILTHDSPGRNGKRYSSCAHSSI